MPSARNKVIAGDYKNRYVTYSGFTGAFISGPGLVSKTIDLNKTNVESYELITEDKMKSGTSAILRGALGAAILGPVGILAGLTAKNKGIYCVAIQFKDGKKSLLEVDDEIYKGLIKSLF